MDAQLRDPRRRRARQVEVGGSLAAGAIGSTFGAGKAREVYRKDPRYGEEKFQAHLVRARSATTRVAGARTGARVAHVLEHGGEVRFRPLVATAAAGGVAAVAHRYQDYLALRERREARKAAPVAKADWGEEPMPANVPRSAYARGIGRVRILGYHGNNRFRCLDRSDSERVIHRDQLKFHPVKKGMSMTVSAFGVEHEDAIEKSHRYTPGVNAYRSSEGASGKNRYFRVGQTTGPDYQAAHTRFTYGLGGIRQGRSRGKVAVVAGAAAAASGGAAAAHHKLVARRKDGSVAKGAGGAAAVLAGAGALQGAVNEGVRRHYNRKGANVTVRDQYRHPYVSQYKMNAAAMKTRAGKLEAKAQAAQPGSRRAARATKYANASRYNAQVYNDVARAGGVFRFRRQEGGRRHYDKTRHYDAPSTIGKSAFGIEHGAGVSKSMTSTVRHVERALAPRARRAARTLGYPVKNRGLYTAHMSGDGSRLVTTELGGRTGTWAFKASPTMRTTTSDADGKGAASRVVRVKLRPTKAGRRAAGGAAGAAGVGGLAVAERKTRPYA